MIASFNAMMAAHSSPRAQSVPLFRVSQPLGEVATGFSLDPAGRIRAIHHHLQLVEFPGLDPAIAAPRRARHIAHARRLTASRQRFDALFRATERLRQCVCGETRSVPVRPVHNHADERVGYEQMLRTAVLMQHAHGQVMPVHVRGDGSG